MPNDVHLDPYAHHIQIVWKRTKMELVDTCVRGSNGKVRKGESPTSGVSRTPTAHGGRSTARLR